MITEGKSTIEIPKGLVTKKDDVFYNPVMKFNRDMSVLFLNSINKKNMQVCDLLAGSGIRSIRFLKELKKESIKALFINDKHADFLKIMKHQLKINKIPTKDVKFYKNHSDYKYKEERVKQHINKKLIIKKLINVTCEEATQLLLKTAGFDYIEIDPFGTPNPFLDAATKMVAREGILGITATDTAALTGTYLNPTKRKYWAHALKNELMHEIGLRILIRKIQLIGAQYEKALIPQLSYSKDHYYRTFLKCKKGKEQVDIMQKQHHYLLHCTECFTNEYSMFNNKICCKKQMLFAGPMWSGKLQDRQTLLKMKTKEDPFLKLLLDEDSINSTSFYDIHTIAKKRKKGVKHKFENIIREIKKQNYFASRSHFSILGIKTNMPAKDLLKLLS